MKCLVYEIWASIILASSFFSAKDQAKTTQGHSKAAQVLSVFQN